MRFHVAREGAVLGEFEEQIFRSKVFSGRNPAERLVLDRRLHGLAAGY
jgi:hypothetical protein